MCDELLRFMKRLSIRIPATPPYRFEWDPCVAVGNCVSLNNDVGGRSKRSGDHKRDGTDRKVISNENGPVFPVAMSAMAERAKTLFDTLKAPEPNTFVTP